MKINKKLSWVGILLVLPLVLSAASCQRTVIEDEDLTDDTNVEDITSDATDNALDDLLPSGDNQPTTASGLPDPDIIDAESKVEEIGRAHV